MDLDMNIITVFNSGKKEWQQVACLQAILNEHTEKGWALFPGNKQV